MVSLAFIYGGKMMTHADIQERHARHSTPLIFIFWPLFKNHPLYMV